MTKFITAFVSAMALAAAPAFADGTDAAPETTGKKQPAETAIPATTETLDLEAIQEKADQLQQPASTPDAEDQQSKES